LFGALFAHQFLNLRSFIPKSKRLGIILLSITLLFYLMFVFTRSYLYGAIGDTFALVTLFYYWILGIRVYKTHEFGKFFTIGYSLVMLSAIFFVAPINWGFDDFSVTLKSVKLGALFEMLLLTYAITYRVKVLQIENDQFKNEIQAYLDKILSLEHKMKNSSSSNENKITLLTERFSLTNREADVLQLISSGYTNQKIANELFVSLNTVKYHIRNIYQKLDIKNKGEAINIISSQ
jgi:DNA-binding CsgD family transcriptional regulator